MMGLSKKLGREFSKFDEEQKRLLICAVSRHTASVLCPEKKTYVERNLVGLDKTSLEWLIQFLTSHIGE